MKYRDDKDWWVHLFINRVETMKQSKPLNIFVGYVIKQMNFISSFQVIVISKIKICFKCIKVFLTQCLSSMPLSSSFSQNILLLAKDWYLVSIKTTLKILKSIMNNSKFIFFCASYLFVSAIIYDFEIFIYKVLKCLIGQFFFQKEIHDSNTSCIAWYTYLQQDLITFTFGKVTFHIFQEGCSIHFNVQLFL